MSNVISFNKNTKVNVSNVYAELFQTLENLPEQDKLTDLALNTYLKTNVPLEVLFDLRKPIAELDGKEIALINLLSDLSKTLDELNEKLNSTVSPVILSGIQNCVSYLNSGDNSLATVGLEFYSEQIGEDVNEYATTIRRYNTMYQLTKIKYISSIYDRTGCNKFCVKDYKIYPAKDAYSLISLNSL